MRRDLLWQGNTTRGVYKVMREAGPPAAKERALIEGKDNVM